MALKELTLSLCMIAALPASAGAHEPDASQGAPAGTAETRYCLKIEAVTGSIIEQVRCWTRAEWKDQGVDLDKEWAREGVGIREPAR